MFDLRQTLLALLHSSNEPLSPQAVQAVFARYHEEEDLAAGEGEEVHLGPEQGQALFGGILDAVPSLLTTTQIRDALAELGEDLARTGATFRLREGPGGYWLEVAPAYRDWVRLLRAEPRPQRLGTAQLEALAIVAYRQPVTRAEVEAIRGVASDSALNRLVERGLVEVTGRADLPGRPLQYGTTEAFLHLIGLTSLEQLPASDVLSPQQITAWIKEATLEAPPTDEAMGLPLG